MKNYVIVIYKDSNGIIRRQYENMLTNTLFYIYNQYKNDILYLFKIL